MNGAPPLARADWSADGTARCDWPSRLSIARGGGGSSGSHSLPLRERVPKLSRAGRGRGLDGRRDRAARPRGRPQPGAGPGAMPPHVPCPHHSPLGPPRCHPAPHRGLQLGTLRWCHRHPMAVPGAPCALRHPLVPRVPGAVPGTQPRAWGQPQAAGQGLNQAVRGSQSPEEGSGETPTPCPWHSARLRAAPRRAGGGDPVPAP